MRCSPFLLPRRFRAAHESLICCGPQRLDMVEGILSPSQANVRFAQSVIRSAAASGGQEVSQTCELDAPGGPLEVSEEEWDGVSIWVGNIPRHAVSRSIGEKEPDGAVLSAATWTSSAQQYALSTDFAEVLNSFGEGLQADRTVVFRHQRIWALVTFRQRQDAEACLSSDIRTEWVEGPGSLGSPSLMGSLGGSPGVLDSKNGDRCSGLLLKRAVSVEQAQADLDYQKKVARQRREMVERSVTRIHGWLKRSGMQLSDLFNAIDKDSSGDFDMREFRAGMLTIGLTFEDAEITALFSHMDRDGSGSINIQEFIAKMDQFSADLSESAETILLHLCV